MNEIHNRKRIIRFVRPILIIFVCIIIYLCNFIYIQSLQKHGIYSSRHDPFYLEINSSMLSMTKKPYDIKKFGLYLNYQEQYSCPYYTDRADMIAPEINRLAQFLRSFGSPIIFYVDANAITFDFSDQYDDIDFDQKPSPYNSEIDISEKQHLNETSPKFKDLCLFKDFDSAPLQPNYSVHHSIKYSTSSDYFISNHNDLIKKAKELKLSHVFLVGIRSNLWMTSLIENLQQSGIEPLYLWDLGDVAFSKETQSDVFETHNIAREHYLNYLIKHGVRIVNHYAILDRKYLDKPYGKDIDFDGNHDAYYFSHYFHGLYNEH